MDLGPNYTLRKGRGRKGKGPYVGVRLRGGRWVSEIRIPRTSTRIWLGSHQSPEKAARAYDAALYCLRGEEGSFNFPNNRRPDLGNRAVGSLSIDEIQSIAAKFACSDETVAATPEPSTMLPLWAAHLSLAPPVVSDLQNLNEMPENDVEPELYAPAHMPQEESYVPTSMPEEGDNPISVPEEAYIQTSVPAEAYIPTFVPEEAYVPTSVPEENPYVPTSLPEEEAYIPTFVPEEELHTPAYAPGAGPMSSGIAQLEEWFSLDEDWAKNYLTMF